MRDSIILLVHLIATLARLMGPGGLRSVVAESVLVKQQLLILNRSRHRAPNLCASDRILAGMCALFMRPARVIRSAIVLRPSTILEFHRALRTRKYRWLFSPTRRRTGPQGPSKALVDAIVDMKRRNPRWGCPRIAQQIALAFVVDIDKDVVRRVLATHYRPTPHSGGPSWLTFLGHAKDSLWSIDLFRCESAILRSHWVLVVMDQYTRRIVGFGIHAGTVDGRALCRMFNHAIRGLSRPKRLSSDHDPLYRFHQWRANLRVLQVTEVKSVPYVPLSHPFVALLRGSKTDPQRPLPTDPLTTDSVRRRPTKLSHLIEDVTCEDGLRLLPRPTARSKALPDDQLVPEEGVLHTGLLMVARVLLPLSPSSLLHLSDRAVARGRSWSPSRHGGCPGRWNDDRRATRTRSLVEATRVVGRVRREAGDVAFDLVDQIEGRRRVVNMPAGQGVSDDHARSVDAQMKLLPAAYTASAMFHGRPFTFTHSREPGTVDDEMYACARGEAAKCKVEVLTTP